MSSIIGRIASFIGVRATSTSIANTQHPKNRLMKSASKSSLTVVPNNNTSNGLCTGNGTGATSNTPNPMISSLPPRKYSSSALLPRGATMAMTKKQPSQKTLLGAPEMIAMYAINTADKYTTTSDFEEYCQSFSGTMGTSAMSRSSASSRQMKGVRQFSRSGSGATEVYGGTISGHDGDDDGTFFTSSSVHDMLVMKDDNSTTPDADGRPDNVGHRSTTPNTMLGYDRRSSPYPVPIIYDRKPKPMTATPSSNNNFNTNNINNNNNNNNNNNTNSGNNNAASGAAATTANNASSSAQSMEQQLLNLIPKVTSNVKSTASVLPTLRLHR